MDKTSVFLLLFLLAGLINELIGELMYQLGIATNLSTYFYTIILGPILSLLYLKEIHQNFLKKIIVGYMIAHVILSLLNFYLNPNMIMEDKPYVFLVTFFFLISIYYLYDFFKRMEVPDITRHLFFWINSALMLFFGTSFIVQLFSSIVRSDVSLFLYLWPIQLLATILLNLLIVIGIWRTRRI